jgi:CheY-like chemotaxis protein
LIVDDDSDTVELLAELASSLGHEVVVAQDGPAALTRVATFRPDIALVDVGLPGINGYELARRMREVPGMKAVPLVAVTDTAASKIGWRRWKPGSVITWSSRLIPSASKTFSRR